MTVEIPVWIAYGGGGFALGVAFMFWVGLRFNARQVAKTKADALKAVTERHGHGTGA